MTAEPLPTRAPAHDECPDCAYARQELMAERIRRQDCERDLATKRARITFLENEAAGKRRVDPLYETAQTIWEFWRTECSPKARAMNDRQLKALLQVLKKRMPNSDEKAYSPRYVCEAVRGFRLEHYVDDRGKKHKGLELICSKIEDGHERYERAQERARTQNDPARMAAGPLRWYGARL